MSQFGDFSLFLPSHFPEVILAMICVCVVYTCDGCQHFLFIIILFFHRFFSGHLFLLEAITFLAYPSTLSSLVENGILFSVQDDVCYIIFHIAICWYFYTLEGAIYNTGGE